MNQSEGQSAQVHPENEQSMQWKDSDTAFGRVFWKALYNVCNYMQ